MPLDVVLVVGQDKLGSVSKDLFEREVKKAIDLKYDTTTNKLTVRFVPGIHTMEVMVNGQTTGALVAKVKSICEGVGCELSADACEIDADGSSRQEEVH